MRGPSYRRSIIRRLDCSTFSTSWVQWLLETSINTNNLSNQLFWTAVLNKPWTAGKQRPMYFLCTFLTSWVRWLLKIPISTNHCANQLFWTADIFSEDCSKIRKKGYAPPVLGGRSTRWRKLPEKHFVEWWPVWSRIIELLFILYDSWQKDTRMTSIGVICVRWIYRELLSLREM